MCENVQSSRRVQINFLENLSFTLLLLTMFDLLTLVHAKMLKMSIKEVLSKTLQQVLQLWYICQCMEAIMDHTFTEISYNFFCDI